MLHALFYDVHRTPLDRLCGSLYLFGSLALFTFHVVRLCDLSYFAIGQAVCVGDAGSAVTLLWAQLLHVGLCTRDFDAVHLLVTVKDRDYAVGIVFVGEICVDLRLCFICMGKGLCLGFI